jgi:nucleotide-binding universal stress UspA family protein
MTQRFTIMAAVDLSDYSAMTVRYSVWLAKKINAALLLVSVINQRDLDMVRRAMVGYEAFSLPNYMDEQVKDRKARMKELFEAASPTNIDCNYLVREGVPYLELLATIQEQKPNLLVVSAKGRSNLADVVVGSTARKMYRRSPIPLVTIPAGFSDTPF